MTERLYYTDSHIKSFTARVLSCEQTEKGFAVTLDRTAFFPEGGGQLGDSGYIAQVRVFDTHEKNGEVLHYVNQALTVGEQYDCKIDWEQRYRRMQNHSGEHIVSGLVNKRYGYSNVGFHMGSDAVTIDFDGFISPEQLAELENEANRRVFADLKITTSFPSSEELNKLDYRSKLELTENVRIVEIEDTDVCACCAPHVYSTAEVGIIKFLSCERRRRGGDGVRISMLCGLDAYEHLAQIYENNAAVSVMLSAKRDNTAAAVERLLSEQEKQKGRIAELSREIARQRAETIEQTEGNICIFDSVLDEPSLREIVNSAVEKCTGIAAVFSGDDQLGYKYIIGSKHVDLKKAAKSLNEGINGRGGGKSEMIQGSCAETAENITKFLINWTV